MDISAMLQYYNNTLNTTAAGSTGTNGTTNSTTGTEGATGDLTSSFTSLLKGEMSELQENQNLVKALDGTVVADLADLSDLSTDMLRTGSGQKMLQELMNGQFSSIVTSPSDQKDDTEEKTVTEAVLGTDEEPNSTVDELLKKMEKLIDTAKTSESK